MPSNHIQTLWLSLCSSLRSMITIIDTLWMHLWYQMTFVKNACSAYWTNTTYLIRKIQTILHIKWIKPRKLIKNMKNFHNNNKTMIHLPRIYVITIYRTETPPTTIRNIYLMTSSTTANIRMLHMWNLIFGRIGTEMTGL